MRKNFFYDEDDTRNELPREIVDAQLLKVFKVGLEAALSKVT